MKRPTQWGAQKQEITMLAVTVKSKGIEYTVWGIESMNMHNRNVFLYLDQRPSEEVTQYTQIKRPQKVYIFRNAHVVGVSESHVPFSENFNVVLAKLL
jgi:hypothetical protein